MAKQLIPTKLYKYITKLLYNKDLINEIPPQKWTAKSTVYGFLRTSIAKDRRTGKVVYMKHLAIYLNKDCCPCTIQDLLTDPEKSLKDIFELVDTICHELAHMTYKNHSDKHRQLTQLYKDIFSESIDYDIIKLIDLLKDCKEA